MEQKYRISTHTATCSINSKVDLAKVFDILVLCNRVIYIEHGKNTKGINPKQLSEKKQSKKKAFYNQITIVVQPEIGFKNNIKLFNNGSISMTGLKKIEHGKISVGILLEKIKSVYHSSSIVKYNIELINSDFRIDYEIKRNELHKLLINDYKIFSSYEPCIYPGVNSKFYWNRKYDNHEYIGRCYCTTSCSGKGRGDGNGDCKVITIAAFQSGSIIITGANNIEQIDIAHDFITKLFNQHKERLKQIDAPFLKESKPIKKNIKDKIITYIKKDSIINVRAG
jgi:TATA-box binding protein (TBP) (component of TFIID and TFIIIB)